MTELDFEREELLKADRHLLEGEARIARQRQIIGDLDGAHLSTAGARHLLQTLEETLVSWQSHRDLIVARISVLEAQQH